MQLSCVLELSLNQIESDFIEFVAKKRNRPYAILAQTFLETRMRFRFSGLQFRELGDTIHNLFRVMYDDSDETALVESYRFHALLHLFRFISYSYPGTPKPRDYYYLKYFLKAISRGELKFILHRASQCLHNNYVEVAKTLVDRAHGCHTVVDYGCGLGYISFEIGKLVPNCEVHLVDIDCLTLEFAEFRFRKHAINVHVIPVSEDQMYPKLPPCNVCIATEVMEHVMQPLRVYKNIYEALQTGGILYGDFSNHHKEIFHVTPQLDDLRQSIAKDFRKLDSMSYEKIR